MSAMGKRARVAMVTVVLALCVGCDQATKEVAASRLAGEAPIEALGGLVRLVYAENRGAMLSMGAGLGADARFWIFQVGVGVLLAAMLGLALVQRELTRLQIVGVALLVGGGLSNLIDRVLYEGAVIDFMVLGQGSLKTGVFNVADVAIMAGVGVALVGSILDARRQAASEATTPS